MASRHPAAILLIFGAGLVFLGSVGMAGASEATQKRLKDLFELQWMIANKGQPSEATGEAGRFRLSIGQQFLHTSNADSVPHNAKNDQYFNPWITADWRHPISEGMNWYSGLKSIGYFYTHNSDLNYSYAEAYTGLDVTYFQRNQFSAEAYAGLALDYDLTASFGTDDIEASVSVGTVLTWDAGAGHTFYLTPDLTGLRAFPVSKIENSYLSATLTPGWSFEITPALTAGVYWCGSVAWYPEARNEVGFTQYVGVNLDWQMLDTISLGLICIYTANDSSCPTSDYSDLSAGITLRFSLDLLEK
jgi:hypothetical protein